MQNYELYAIKFLLHDQPTTCPFCGARTDIILDLEHTIRQSQVHQCLNRYCKFEFATEVDDEFEE